MSDPRIDPNYRGVKCKGCGEYLPFLFNRLCTHCALEAKDAEIERLRGALERIAELYYPAEIQRIAREALREVGDE